MTVSYTGRAWAVDVAGWTVDLPILALRPHLAISLMTVIDMGVRFGAHVGARLAERLAPLRPDILVGTATLGIPVAIEATRALGLDHYVILQKSPKLHLADALIEPISSITSRGEQSLLLDRRSVPRLKGRRVVVVDDVVASGSSLKGSLTLTRRAGAELVGIGVILTEGHGWRAALGPDAGLVQALAHIPQFTSEAGAWHPLPDTL